MRMGMNSMKLFILYARRLEALRSDLCRMSGGRAYLLRLAPQLARCQAIFRGKLSLHMKLNYQLCLTIAKIAAFRSSSGHAAMTCRLIVQ